MTGQLSHFASNGSLVQLTLTQTALPADQVVVPGGPTMVGCIQCTCGGAKDSGRHCKHSKALIELGKQHDSLATRRTVQEYWNVYDVHWFHKAFWLSTYVKQYDKLEIGNPLNPPLSPADQVPLLPHQFEKQKGKKDSKKEKMYVSLPQRPEVVNDGSGYDVPKLKRCRFCGNYGHTKCRNPDIVAVQSVLKKGTLDGFPYTRDVELEEMREEAMDVIDVDAMDSATGGESTPKRARTQAGQDFSKEVEVTVKLPRWRKDKGIKVTLRTVYQ
jgi:hypothetical protein